jgi:large subunit ribosomal protein L19
LQRAVASEGWEFPATAARAETLLMELAGEETMGNVLDLVRSTQLKSNLPEISVGDTVRVHARIVEGNKERVQVFEGTVIRRRKANIDASITVRRLSGQIGVERTFLVNSPRIDKFEVVRHGAVRRAALYYLRKRTGKSARIREKRYVPQAAAKS